MGKLTFALILLLAISLAACAPDPRDAAEATAIVLRAEQDAADRTQARTQAEAQAVIALAEAQTVSAQRTQAINSLIRWAGIFGTIAVCGALLATGAGFSWAAVGTGKAWARLAEVRANLIGLNEATRQFPLVMHYLGKGRYSLANPNTGSIAELDTRRPEDRQLITVSGAVMLAGVVAREARRSVDPAGVAVIQPAIVRSSSDE